jgi:sugar/nucleoside kinase (ribokinase family)
MLLCFGLQAFAAATSPSGTNFRRPMDQTANHRFFEHTLGGHEAYKTAVGYVTTSHATGFGGGLGGDEDSSFYNQHSDSSQFSHHHSVRADYTSNFDAEGYLLNANGDRHQADAPNDGVYNDADHYDVNSLPGEINKVSTHAYRTRYETHTYKKKQHRWI